MSYIFTDGHDFLNRLKKTDASQRYPARNTPVDQLAERVLLSVRSRLQGFVSGNSVANSNETSINCAGGSGIAGGLDQLDVAAHVGSLVRPAIDH
ncbi:unnamed protein product [Trichobilharzia szidati]|nr:unnamed protein product [Trichobilharzia szidati]